MTASSAACSTYYKATIAPYTHNLVLLGIQTTKNRYVQTQHQNNTKATAVIQSKSKLKIQFDIKLEWDMVIDAYLIYDCTRQLEHYRLKAISWINVSGRWLWWQPSNSWKKEKCTQRELKHFEKSNLYHQTLDSH